MTNSSLGSTSEDNSQGTTPSSGSNSPTISLNPCEDVIVAVAPKRGTENEEVRSHHWALTSFAVILYVYFLGTRLAAAFSETIFRAKEQSGGTSSSAGLHLTNFETNELYIQLVGGLSTVPNILFTRAETLWAFVTRDLLGRWYHSASTDLTQNTSYYDIVLQGEFHEYKLRYTLTHGNAAESVEAHDDTDEAQKVKVLEHTFLLSPSYYKHLNQDIKFEVQLPGSTGDKFAVELKNFKKHTIHKTCGYIPGWQLLSGLFFLSAFMAFLTCLLSGYVAIYIVMEGYFGNDIGKLEGSAKKWTEVAGVSCALSLGVNFLCYGFGHIQRNTFDFVIKPNSSETGKPVQRLQQDQVRSFRKIFAWFMGSIATIGVTGIIYLNVRRANLILLCTRLGWSVEATTIINLIFVPFILMANLFGRGGQTAKLIDGGIDKFRAGLSEEKSLQKTLTRLTNQAPQADYNFHIKVISALCYLLQIADAYNGAMASANGWFKLWSDDMPIVVSGDNPLLITSSYVLGVIYLSAILAFTTMPANIRAQDYWLRLSTYVKSKCCGDMPAGAKQYQSLLDHDRGPSSLNPHQT